MLPNVPLTAGRSSELRLVGQALDDIGRGRGGCLWIEGDPGIGKSHLVGVLAAEASARGHEVLIGHADQLMQTFPLRTAAAVLDIATWSADLERSRIAHLLGGAHPEHVAYLDPVLAAAERMIELVERMCAERPLVLVFEDVHWSDDASLTFIERLNRVAGQVPLLLVPTSRPAVTEPGSAREALRSRAGRRLELGPLAPAEVATLVRARLDADPGPRLSGLLEVAEGNPLYLCEILALLGRDDLAADDGSGDHPAGTVELTTPDLVPARLAEALERRLRTLPPEHAQALRWAGLLGESFSIDDLAVVLAEDPGPALESAASADLISLGRNRARFRHKLIRQTLIDPLSPAVRDGMHDHIARTLAAAYRPDNLVAGHLIAAGDPLAGWALDWLSARAETTLYTAPDAYSVLLRRAVSASPAPRRSTLLRQLMLVSFWLGRDDAVVEAGEEAIPALGADRDLTARLRIQVLRSLARQRRFDEALTVAAPSIHDAKVSQVWRARALAWQAAVQAFVGDPEEARAASHRALDLATEAADPLGIASAHSALAPVDGADRMIGHLQAGVDVLSTDALSNDPEALDLRLQMAGNLAARLGTEGDPRAEAVLAQALTIAERVGTYRTCTLRAHAAGYYFEHGRWDEALLHIEQMDASKLRHPAFAYLLGIRAVIAYRRGAFAEGAQALLDAGVPEPAADETPAPSGPVVTDAAALRAEAAGRHDQALRIRAQYLDLPNSAQRDSRSAEAMYLIRLARSLGEEATARAACDTVSAVASSPPSEDGRLTIAACQAVIAGDGPRLLEIAEEFLAGQWLTYAAYAFEEAAAALTEAGDMAAARAPFLRATDIYDEAGLDWDLRRAAARFRAYGIRRAPRPRGRDTRTGWSALTETEMQISHLVARGYTNSDIAREMLVSRNTVQSHVSKILAKLDQSSRAELAREVVLRGGSAVPAAPNP
ncbi:helix-turn-helix transcriptional regulator [Catenulispora rubra]|uniref:helix-turn-helix transcriptional regulator n=1 Tax=Catenulispora rubra TaxID=280293 RepID=UPI0018927CD7|nr:LuxR family transcriptional regulator [Catenulispora rubra]